MGIIYGLCYVWVFGEESEVDRTGRKEGGLVGAVGHFDAVYTASSL